MPKRAFIKNLALFGIAGVGLPAIVQAQARPQNEVWTLPCCGCCHDWVAYPQANGFQVKVHSVSESDKAIQRRTLNLSEKCGANFIHKDNP